MALFFECMLLCAHKVLDRGRHCQRRLFSTVIVHRVAYLAQRKPTKSAAPAGGWLSRYSTQKFTGEPSKLPPRMTRRVLTSRNDVPSRNRLPPATGLF